MRFLRSVVGYSFQITYANDVIREKYGLNVIMEVVKKYRMQWRARGEGWRAKDV
jgi:hypothetical protein